MAKRSKTKAEREYLNTVAALGCCVCGGPAEIHHITSGVGMGQRASDYDVIPLCHIHHRNGGHGVAIHAGKKTWEGKHGLELDFLALVKRTIGDPNV